MAGFTGDHIQRLREKAIEIISQTKRVALVVDFENQTWPRAVGAATGIFFKEKSAACRHLEALQKETETVLVIISLSRCKTVGAINFARGLIKNIDDAHFGCVYPRSNLIFIDYASFLEKNWGYIGNYLQVATLDQNLNIYPRVAEEPLRAVT